MGSEGLMRGVLEGCIVGGDMEIERRPYHRNCSCALHQKRSRGGCSKGSMTKIAYPIRRAWSESCLVMAASLHPSPSSSPANANATQVPLCKKENVVLECTWEE
ncbi:hypothetical protein AAC387_Pa04g1142 [Persea americana]